MPAVVAVADDTINVGMTGVDSMAGVIEAVVASREVTVVTSSGTKALELMTDETSSSVEVVADMEDSCIIDLLEATFGILVSSTDLIMSIKVGCGKMEPVFVDNDLTSVEGVAGGISAEASTSVATVSLVEGLGKVLDTSMLLTANTSLLVVGVGLHCTTEVISKRSGGRTYNH